MVEKVINLNDLIFKKEYIQKYNCPQIKDVCEEFKETIINNDFRCVNDIITELSSLAINKYVSDLLKTCSNIEFMPYMNKVFEDFGTPQSVSELYTQAEFIYYFDSLNENKNIVIHNAIADYLDNKTITLNTDKNEINKITEEIKNKITYNIEHITIDFDAPANYILKDFENSIIDILETYNNEKETIKIKFSESDDEDFQTMPILFFEVGKSPEILYLKENDDTLSIFQGLVGGYIETISLKNITNDKNRCCDLIVNESGKIYGLPINKSLKFSHIDEFGSAEIFDVACGNIIICGVDLLSGSFTGLKNEELEYWKSEFSKPEKYLSSFYFEDEKTDIFDRFESKQKNKVIKHLDIDDLEI